MTSKETTVSPESIMAEFPGVNEYTADDLAYRIQEPLAAANILDILRGCPEEFVEQAIDIVTQQMNNHDCESEEWRDPISHAIINESLWYYEDGFPEIRTQVIKTALRSLGQNDPETISLELEKLDPWISRIEEMRLKPAVLSLQDCFEQSQLWERHIINREYSHGTAAILNSDDDELAAWNTLVEAQKMEDYIIAAIRNQEELATEAALNNPSIYPRYINKCIANTARPFAVIKDWTGHTKTLCVLCFRKGAWRLSEPARLHQDEAIIKLLQGFAKKYQVLQQKAGSNSHRSWRRQPTGPGTDVRDR